MNGTEDVEDGVYKVEFLNNPFTYRCEKIKGVWYFTDGTGWKAGINNWPTMISVEEISHLPDLPELEKPPNGIMPRNIWERDRQLNLLAAMSRYVEEGLKIDPEWIHELQDLNEREE